MTDRDYITQLENRNQSLEACLTTLISAGKGVIINDNQHSRQTLINAIQEVKDAPQRVTRLEALERLYVTAWKFSVGDARILDLVCAVNAVKQYDAEGI
jgi:hypothetical protein